MAEDDAESETPIREAMDAKGLSFEDVANELGVSTRAVRFWAAGRSKPQPPVRPHLARLLDVSPVDLWPSDESDTEPSVIAEYRRLIDVPRSLWERLLISADKHIDVMTGGGRFYLEQYPDLADVLASKQRLGSNPEVRVCLADPTTEAVREREQEEAAYSNLEPGLLPANAATVARQWKTELQEYDAGEVRVSDHTWRISIFRFDDDMIAQVYVFGGRGIYTTAEHLRRTNIGGRFDQYMEHFDRIWTDHSRPADATLDP